MRLSRGSSNQKKNAQQQQMQAEAQRMEEKLAKLKANLNNSRSERQSAQGRWGSENGVLKEIEPSQRRDTSQIEEFLKSIKMESYTQKFLENGFEELDLLLEVQNDHLQEMQIPIGHQIRLMKKIEEMRSASKYEPLEEPAVDLSFSQQNSEMQTQIKRSSLSQSKERKPRQAKSVKFKEPDLHFEGMKEEITNSLNKSFFLMELQSLCEYMKGKDDKDFLADESDVGSQFEPPPVETLQQIEEKRKSIERNAEVLRTRKVACWNCYKLLELGQRARIIKEEECEFCSQDCRMKYLKQFEADCYGCKRIMDMRQAVFLNGALFCSDGCASAFDFVIMKTSKEEIEEVFKPLRLENEQPAMYDLQFGDILINEFQ